MTASDDILIALRVRGTSSEFGLSIAVGATVEVVATHLRELDAAQLVQRSTVGLGGWELQEAGEQRVDALIANVTAGRLQWLDGAYESFMSVDPLVKAMCTAWQGASPRDTDATWPVMLRLVEDAAGSFRMAGLAVDRFQRYTGRLEAASERVRSGDQRFVAHPHVDSFHSVWFEAHEEFLLLLGRKRGEE
jgi:hypothetical protein